MYEEHERTAQKWADTLIAIKQAVSTFDLAALESIRDRNAVGCLLSQREYGALSEIVFALRSLKVATDAAQGVIL